MSDLLTSDFNLQRLDTKQFFAHIKASIEAKSNIAGFGFRGIGKTSITRQAITAADHLLVYCNLATYERPDLSGYPNIANSPDQFVHHLFPIKFQPLLEGNKPCVLLLDELDKADSSLNAPLLELIEDHAMNGTKFPNLMSVISTGNLVSEGGTRPIPPLLDRTEKYLVEATVEAWLEWAGAHIHPSVRAFIHDKPGMLLDVVDHPTHFATRSPRGWHKTSNICHFGEKFDWDVDLINEKAAGFVGKQAGSEFQLYFSQYKTLLPLVDGIFNERNYKSAFDNLSPNEKLYVAMIVSSRFAGYLDSNKPTEEYRDSPKHKQMLKVSGTFYTLLYSVHPEFCLICVQQQIGNTRWPKWKLDTVPEWNGIINSINKLAGK